VFCQWLAEQRSICSVGAIAPILCAPYGVIMRACVGGTVMLRVVICVALFLSGCAVDPPATIVRTRIVKEYITEPRGTRFCPTDNQIKEIAIAASRATYFKRNRSGACPCRDDRYKRNGVELPCGNLSAEAKTGWVLCRKEQVPAGLVTEMKAKIPECQVR